MSGYQRKIKADVEVQMNFVVENGEGYALEIVDLGGDGIKITLSHDEDDHAILLSPEKAAEAIKWLNKTIGQS